MKNILMGVSALAIATTIGGAGKAEAVQWDLDWGGFYNSALIYREGDGLNSDQEGIDVVQDGEIQFTPSIVTDNGLQFGVVVEIEADPTSSQTIDDSHVFVEGPFGRFDIGSESGAASKMHYGAPNAGWFGAVDGGDVAGSYLQLDILNFGRSPAWAGAANRISYFTPRFSGFQVGASYAHDDNQNKNSPNAVGGVGNNYDLGANYVQSYGSVDVAVGGVYSTAENLGGGDDFDMYGVGATVGVAGFILGGNYTVQDLDQGSDLDYFDVGVAYSTGPWSTSIHWSHHDQGSREADHFLGAATYQVGPGVTAGVYAGYAEGDSTTGNDVDGFLVGTGFALSF